MTPDNIAPDDRATFNEAIASIRADHAVLRDLAKAASMHVGSMADETMSLADAMLAHESAEARLFALPFVTRPPDSVISTSARARQRCLEYKSGTYRLPNAEAAAGVFIDALLTHLAVEDTWLDHEDEHQKDRLRTIA
ncbi:MAG: hypothetical protein KJ634_07640 [Gammaproteobacteria bacterium]|nr:hypothetical protein [Gammaproteobacteria bacterium]MBU1415481.1 hypothetical protein [Gammaproteobacteria bacterium]